MSRPTRRQLQQPATQYAAVPQSPSAKARNSTYQPQAYTPQPQVGGPRPLSSVLAGNNLRSGSYESGRNAMAMGVANGNIGAGYGPYSVRFIAHLQASSSFLPFKIV